MKKTHRAVLSILLVLTLLATLPLTALADNLPNNTGTIGTNEGTITNNGVPADTNTNYNPTSGTVNVNNDTGVITNNYGTVNTNGGTGAPKISNNYGLVTENSNFGTVENNKQGGTIQNNSGLVGEKDNVGALITSDTSGNYGIVTNNNEGGQVCNREGGEVTNNNEGGEVCNLSGGEVTNNYRYGTVNNDGGKVTNNSGTVNNNGGTVKTNNIDGVVEEYSGQTNKVETNYGTYAIYNTDALMATPTAVYYGVHGEDEDGNKYYYKDTAENQSGNTAFVGYQEGTEVDLDEVVSQYKREGYKLVSYTPYTYNKDSNSDDHLEPQTSGNPIFVGKENDTDSNSTSYYITAPTLLKLTWEKITSIFKPAASTDSSVGGGGGAEAVELSAGKRYIGLGSVIFINEKGYKVVEIKDDAYVVVTFDALPDEDVQDLDALYAKLFTAEQQKLIKNLGQLLSSEDVLTVFGKPGNHPVYEISKDLVK